MSKDMMWDCEMQKMHVDLNDPKNVSKRTLKWVVVAVSSISKGSGVRCMHCHGPVRIHRQKQAHGTRDHVEHLIHEDSENCKGGFFFKGTHRMSSNAVN
jgi:hypothetical protein